MSAVGLAPPGLYDSGSAYLSPAWFEQLSQSTAAQTSGGTLSTEQATEQVVWNNTVVDTYTDEWIVQLDRDALARVRSVSEVAALFAPADFTFQVVGGLGMEGQVLLRSSGASDDTVEAWLKNDTDIAYYEPNAILPLKQVANDPAFSQLWAMNNTGQTIRGQAGTPDADIDAPEAWDLATGSTSVVVAVIDTGVDYNHPDLAANIWTNPYAGQDGFVGDVHGYNFITNTGNVMDDNGHGTHVAGTIAAVGNNGTGVTGVNWNTSIMALKFLDANGSGSLSNAVRAINYVTMLRSRYGVNVRLTNNSWGGGGYSQSMYDAISASGQAGIMFVAAAGNSGANNDAAASYPASYNLDNVISVAATDNRDQLASFSNYGATSVDLAAPGVNIYSTKPGGGYQDLSGTSMATPHVSGVVALAWSVAPNATLAEIRSAVLGGVDHLASLSGKVATGGRLNARGTLDLLGINVTGSTPAAGATLTTPPTQFTISFSQDYDPASVQASDVTVNGVAASSYTLVDARAIRFNFSASPVTASGTQTMQIAAGAIRRAGGSTGVAAWQSSFNYAPAQADPAVFRYQSADTPLAIPDVGTVISSITISDNYQISDLDVELNISHTYDRDLTVSLVAPNGKTIQLFSRVGGSGDNFKGTIFDDEASTLIGKGAAPFTGTFKPSASLSGVDGLSTKGTWKLIVKDNALHDAGTLNSWALKFQVKSASAPLRLATIPGQTIAYGGAITVALRTSNSGGAPVTFSAQTVSAVPVALTVDSRTGTLTIRPNRQYTGEFCVRVTADNGRGTSAQVFRVRVRPLIGPPPGPVSGASVSSVLDEGHRQDARGTRPGDGQNTYGAHYDLVWAAAVAGWRPSTPGVEPSSSGGLEGVATVPTPSSSGEGETEHALSAADTIEPLVAGITSFVAGDRRDWLAAAQRPDRADQFSLLADEVFAQLDGPQSVSLGIQALAAESSEIDLAWIAESD